MKKWLVLLAALTCGLQAEEWVPTEAFLRAVCFVESSNGKFLVGDGGRSLGHYQISEAAWLDVNQWRKARRLKTYTYRANVMNSFINRAYAANYFTMLHAEISRKLQRAPTHEELYAAYNLGLAMFGRCNYELSQVNSTTRGKCKLIETILGCQPRCT